MAKLKEFYRSAADQHFKANMINDPDDEEAFLRVCKQVMHDNGIPMVDDEDEWLEFVYRAQEICELQENGYYYHKVRDPSKRDGWDYKLEVLENEQQSAS